MITITAAINTDPVDRMLAFLDDHTRIVQDVGETVLSATESELITGLRYEPSAVKHPIEWTSEKQRRAYFATDGFGAGIPYRRTGKLASGWQINSARDASRFEIIIRNPAPQAKFVVGAISDGSGSLASLIKAGIGSGGASFSGGDLGQGSGELLRYMQRFHRNTGWKPAIGTIVQWAEKYRDAFIKEYLAQINEYLQAT